MTSLEDVAETAVHAGSRYLDQHSFGNWREQVDIEKLRMAGRTNCVLAQLYGNYRAGLTALNLTHAEAFHLGFRASHEICLAQNHRKYYRALGLSWRKIILVA